MSTDEKEIYGQLCGFLDRQPDMSVSKIISGWLFDPLNCFDPNSRARPKPEMLIVLSYLLLMGFMFAAFNLPS